MGFEAVPEGPSGAIQVLHIYSNNLVFKFTVAEKVNLSDILVYASIPISGF